MNRMKYLVETKRDCIFCQIVKFVTVNKEYELSFTDRPIFSSHNFFLIQAKHSVNEGHLLLVPVRHYYSLADFSANEFEEFKIILENVQATLRKLFGAISIFEHGMIPESVSKCMEHAHIHFLPIKEKIARFLSDKFDAVEIYENLDHAYKKLKSPYILLKEDSENWISCKITDSIPSQYLCRLYAMASGKKDSSWLNIEIDNAQYRNVWEKLKKEFN